MHVCFVQLYPLFSLIIIVYLPTTTRERAKASEEDPPGVPGPLADASESAGLICLLDRVRAWHYIWRTVPGSTAVGVKGNTDQTDGVSTCVPREGQSRNAVNSY